MTRNRNKAFKPPVPVGNPGVWHGERKAFLEGKLPAFLDWGHKNRKQYVDDTVDEYLLLYPFHFGSGPELPPDATQEQLEAYEAAVAAAKAEARIQAAKQILSWFKNRSTKANNVKKEPFREFLTNGLKAAIARKPRRDEEVKLWMKHDDYRAKFTEEFEKRWETCDREETQWLAYRMEIAREMYKKEDESVRTRIQKLAEESYNERLQAYEASFAVLEGSGTVTPEAAELCRANLVTLLEPLLIEVLRMCGLKVASVILARPPQTPEEKFMITSVHVGHTIKSEGGLKLPQFDPEAYANIFLRHFMRFAVLTTEESAEMNRQEQARKGIPPMLSFEQPEDSPRPSPDVDDSLAPKRSHRRKQRKSPSRSRRKPRRSRNIDNFVLDDTESTEDEGGDDWEDIAEDVVTGQRMASGGAGSNDTDSDGADSDTPLVDVLRRAGRSRFVPNATERDDYGIPLQDAQQRELPDDLREFLSRLSIVNRIKTLNDIDNCSQYEFERHCNIAKNRCAIRRQLAADGLLTRSDRAFYGEVTRRKVVKIGGILAFAHASDDEDDELEGQEGGVAQGDENESGRVDGEHGELRNEEDPRVEEEQERDEVQHEEEEQERSKEEEEERDEEEEEPAEEEAEEEEPAEEETGEEEPNEERHGEEEHAGLRGDGVRDERRQALREEDEDAELRDLLALEGVSMHELERDVASRRQAPESTGACGSREILQAEPVNAHASARPLATPSQPRSSGGRSLASTKRARDGEQDPSPTYPNPFAAEREGWASWFSHAVDNLVLTDAEGAAEAAWVKLVGTWWRLEQLEGYQRSVLLPKSKNRPDDIAAWIKHHRRTAYVPKVPDDTPLRDFLEVWELNMWNWWSDINPKWRARLNDDTVTGRGSGDWSELYCSGVNGHLNILKGLKWWFDLEEKPHGGQSWLTLVEDVQWALDCVVSEQTLLSEKARPTKRRRT